MPKFINFFQLKTGKGFSKLLLLFGSQPSEVDKFLDNEQWHSKGSFLQEEKFRRRLSILGLVKAICGFMFNNQTEKFLYTVGQRERV